MNLYLLLCCSCWNGAIEIDSQLPHAIDELAIDGQGTIAGCGECPRDKVGPPACSVIPCKTILRPQHKCIAGTGSHTTEAILPEGKIGIYQMTYQDHLS